MDKCCSSSLVKSLKKESYVGEGVKFERIRRITGAA